MAITTITVTLLLLVAGILPLSHATISSNQNGDNLHRINNCCNLGYRYFAFSNKPKPSGLYVMPNFCGDDQVNAKVYCDTINGGGGWLVVQRREDGSADFNRNWVEYEDGFGNLTGEFWYGLRALHCLTGKGGWEMRMDIKLADGTKVFLQYKQFLVASAEDKYKLTIGGFQGTTTDPMAYSNAMYFTNKDIDNDHWSNGNCAIHQYGLQPRGGWWYNQCHRVNPNTFYKHEQGVHLNNQW